MAVPKGVNVNVDNLYSDLSTEDAQNVPKEVRVATADDFYDEIGSFSNEEEDNRPIDYVLVFKHGNSSDPTKDAEKAELRRTFEEKLREDGLELMYENLQHFTFVKIYCPFQRLGEEAEKVKYEMDLAGLETNEKEPNCFVKPFLTDRQVDYVSAPFEWEKRQAFENIDKPRKFFRHSVRTLLVHHILINTDIRQDQSDEDKINCRGLLYLLMKKAYTDSFILHNPFVKAIPVITQNGNAERKELLQDWKSCCKFQPLWKIRNYFGEKAALYFAWLGLLLSTLMIPMLVGIGCMIYGLYFSFVAQYRNISSIDYSWVSKACDNQVTPYYGLVVCLWGTIFVEMWKRKCATLAYKWDVNNYELQEPNRPEFYGTTLAKDPVTGVKTPVYPLFKRIIKLLISFVCLLFMVLLVIASVTAVIAYRVILRFNSGLNDAYKGWLFSISSSLMNTVSIMLLGKVYEHLAKILNDWENYRTQTEYDDALILKTFAFQFVNSYTSLFYIAFFRKDVQKNGLFDLGINYRDSCGADDDCMSLLTIQVAVLLIVKPLPKFFRDIILPWLKKVFITNCRKKRSSIHPEEKDNPLVQEYNLFKVNNFTMSEYTEKILMYGYLMMFATAFPLAPLLVILIMSVDMRVDCRRLLLYNRRLIANRAQNIGMWMAILNFLNIVGVVSNAFLIAFTSSFGGNINIQSGSDRSLWIVVVFEHVVFVMKYLLASLIPDIPYSVRLAERRERYQVERIMASMSPKTEQVLQTNVTSGNGNINLTMKIE